MTIRIFIICLLGFMITACGSDSDSGNTALVTSDVVQADVAGTSPWCFC